LKDKNIFRACDSLMF